MSVVNKWQTRTKINSMRNLNYGLLFSQTKKGSILMSITIVQKSKFH